MPSDTANRGSIHTHNGCFPDICFNTENRMSTALRRCSRVLGRLVVRFFCGGGCSRVGVDGARKSWSLVVVSRILRTFCIASWYGGVRGGNSRRCILCLSCRLYRNNLVCVSPGIRDRGVCPLSVMYVRFLSTTHQMRVEYEYAIVRQFVRLHAHCHLFKDGLSMV